MCFGANLKNLHNDTLDAIYDLYFTTDNSTAYDKSESQKLSSITFVIVIFVLITFMAILRMVARILTKGQDITLEDEIMMDRVQQLRKAMNPSLLRTPDDPNSDYRMKNNATPNNSVIPEDPVYQEFEFQN